MNSWSVLTLTAGSGLAIVCAALAATPVPVAGSPASTGPVSYSRDVRPVLSNYCFKCHGPDEGNRQGGLRLDRRDDLFTRRGPGAPVVPGKPDQSRLWLRVSAADPALRMPPPSAHKELLPAHTEVIRRWIVQGAKWEGHWAFEAPRKPAVPRVKNAAWVRNPIDAFILARLEREGLSPSPEADPITLIRRVSLDLTGLPPTPAEVEQFVREVQAEGRGPGLGLGLGLGRAAPSVPDPNLNPNLSPAPRPSRPTPRAGSAYERLVDRLLASPHYGERWGRLWLDAARYADSDGFEKDKPRFVWFYRDWVVGAFNRDLPYNRFVIEQLAGDLLPNPTQDQVVATGFLRNSMINEEGGVDPEQFRMEAMFDRMDALGKSVLGLTIQCAQCHTHKYDPLTQEEYYRMFAFLNNSHEANVGVYTPEQEQIRAEILRQTREIEGGLQHRTPDWSARMAAWEKQVSGDQPEWLVVRPPLDTSGGQKHVLQPDGSILAGGYSPAKHTTEFTVKTDGKPITAVRLELLNDPSLPRGGPGRSLFGLCALTELRVSAGPADHSTRAQSARIISATSDIEQPERPLEPNFDDKSGKRRVTGPIAFAFDGRDETAWGLDAGPGRSNVPRKAVFVFEKPVSYPQGTELTFYLDQKHGGWNNNDNQANNLGRFRFSVTTADKPVADPLPSHVREALAVPTDRRSPAQVASIFSYWRTTRPEWREANEQIARLWRIHPDPATQLVMQERGEMRSTHMLERGSLFKPTRTVEAGVPSFLHPLPKGAPRNRLTFARWLVDPRSPTTSRSLVNRVWQTYFGTGIVSTSEDLGLQSERPSHPELLDYLASVFTTATGARGEERGAGASSALKSGAHPSPLTPHPDPQGLGWSLKRLHKLIVTSATYRQASRVRPELLARDPENRLLARGARFRLDAELVRDVALSASGLLNPKLGGRSLYPPAPEFIFLPPASYGPKVWREETGPDRYRRALYTFRYRSVPYPALQAFDAPNGDSSCVRRARSNTPLQALTTLNEPLFVECAQALALKTLKEGGKSDTERLAFAFRRCVSRGPAAPEVATLLELLSRQRARFAGEAENAWKVATRTPQSPPSLPAGMTAGDLAAWTAVSRVLLNLDETITRE